MSKQRVGIGIEMEKCGDDVVVSGRSLLRADPPVSRNFHILSFLQTINDRLVQQPEEGVPCDCVAILPEGIVPTKRMGAENNSVDAVND